MTKEMINKLMKSLLLISALVILAGALFKLQHWPYGDRLFMSGILAYFILGSYEIRRLRNIITKYQKSDTKVE